MQQVRLYNSPLGKIFLCASEGKLTGLWFEGQKHFSRCFVYKDLLDEDEVQPFPAAKRWLDVYFSGQEPTLSGPVHLLGSAFQREVWDILRTIPYGETVTYGAVARRISQQRGGERMSAQAVGGAVGYNPVSLIIPCHRVVGANGNLTGYNGGIDRKIKLLELEHVDTTRFFMPKAPKKKTAP